MEGRLRERDAIHRSEINGGVEGDDMMAEIGEKGGYFRN
jgi:hypothetical protein